MRLSKPVVKMSFLISFLSLSFLASLPQTFGNATLQPILFIRVTVLNDMRISLIKTEVISINNGTVLKLDENTYRLQAWRYYKVFVDMRIEEGIIVTMKQIIYADRQWIDIDFDLSKQTPDTTTISSVITFGFIIIFTAVGYVVYWWWRINHAKRKNIPQTTM